MGVSAFLLQGIGDFETFFEMKIFNLFNFLETAKNTQFSPKNLFKNCQIAIVCGM